MRSLLPLLLSSLISCAAFGQTYTISTFAGGGLPALNIPGTSAGLSLSPPIAVDPAGNLFFVDQNIVVRLDARTGILTAVAGNGTLGFSGDNGPAASAQLNRPLGLAVDSAGNLYISDSGNSRIRKVTNGVIATVAGNGTTGFSGDNGPATSAQLAFPLGLAMDSAGNLYIADAGNAVIRKVTNGVIATVAGNGTQSITSNNGDNGPATSAHLWSPWGVAVDSAGNLYIADFGGFRIRKVTSGVITTVAGNGTEGFSGDNGPATSAELEGPTGIAVDSAGNLYISEFYTGRIRKVTSGVITTVVGNGKDGFSGDNGPAASAELSYPEGVALDSAANLYITDTGNYRVRKVSNGVIGTVAGNGLLSFSGDNGPATSAQMLYPMGVALDPAGDLYFADSGNYRVRKVSNGVITTVAGDGTQGLSGDNVPATSVQLFNPLGVAADSAGNLYIADSCSNRIRKVANGVMTTVAGTGTAGSVGDNGPATSAQLYCPTGVTVDSAGNLYIADTGNNLVRMVWNGVIITVAGGGSSLGDNGPATAAQLSGPSSVAVDSAGNLYIADTGNGRIRKVSSGVITTVAGIGPPPSPNCLLSIFGEPCPGPFSGDGGPATKAQLNEPTGVAVDSIGNLYIADSTNGRIREVSDGMIATVAGGGSSLGDNGPATAAQLGPFGVAMDSAGDIYIGDTGDNRIRLLTPFIPTLPPSAVTAVHNAASNLSGAIAPGELVTITGYGLGPSQLVSAQVGSDGLYDATLAGAGVQFNGIPAPLIYASAIQVSAVVPYEVTGMSARLMDARKSLLA
jgi:trimeric autotransporter adhesin